MNNLFVYGALMGGGPHGALLSRCVRVPATIGATLYRLPEGAPMAVAGPGRLHGEIVRDVDPRLLDWIDRLLGVPEGVLRRQILDARVGLRHERVIVHMGEKPEKRGAILVPGGKWRHTIRRGDRG